MLEMQELTPGLQCCLRCGRVLTDRALHDAFEEPALESIRAGRAGWAARGEVCRPCLDDYRSLLGERRERAEQRPRREVTGRGAGRVGGWLMRWIGGGARAA